MNLICVYSSRHNRRSKDVKNERFINSSSKLLYFSDGEDKQRDEDADKIFKSRIGLCTASSSYILSECVGTVFMNE